MKLYPSVPTFSSLSESNILLQVDDDSDDEVPARSSISQPPLKMVTASTRQGAIMEEQAPHQQQESGTTSSSQWTIPSTLDVQWSPQMASASCEPTRLIALHGGSASTGFFDFSLMAHPTQSQYSMGAISACTGM